MVRNYIRKTNRGLGYTKELLLEAISKVRSGELSGHQAAVRYNIPNTTLNDRLNGKHGCKSQSLGKPPIFSHSFEKTLAMNLTTLQDHGFALTKKEIVEIVGSYAKSKKIKLPSKSGIPGEGWLTAFARRHSFSIKPLYVEFGWKDKEIIIVKEFYSLIEAKVNELDLTDKPDHIWLIEEHSFSKGKRVANTNKEKDFTVVTAFNGKGGKAPLLTVFEGEESREWMLGKHINVSHKEGLCRDVFKNYFTTIFMNYIDDSHPNMIIYDGQCSHMDIGLVEDARKAKITLIKSANLDVLDLSVTKSLKLRWNEEAETFAGSAKEFANVVTNVFENTEGFEIEEGFKNAGIYPFATVCHSKFDSPRLKEYEDYKMFKEGYLNAKASGSEQVIDNHGKEQHLILKIEPEESAEFIEGEAVFVPMESSETFSLAVRKGLTDKQHGADAELTPNGEDRLTAWIMGLSDAGFSITEDKISHTVFDLAASEESYKMPNRHWYVGFLKRHPEIANIISKSTNNLESATEWLHRLQNRLKSRNLEGVLNDPGRIFCCGAALDLNPKNQTKANAATNDEALTVYITASADGKMQPPSVIFPIKTNFISPNSFNRSMSNWTNAEFFSDHITDVFHPWLINNNISLPVIMLLDNSTPLNLTLTDFCDGNQIILTCLPNRALPLQCVFSKVKAFWKEESLQNLSKDDIAKKLDDYLKKDFEMDIKNGFVNCGFCNYKTDLLTVFLVDKSNIDIEY